jgi:hypothetical protein
MLASFGILAIQALNESSAAPAAMPGLALAADPVSSFPLDWSAAWADTSISDAAKTIGMDRRAYVFGMRVFIVHLLIGKGRCLKLNKMIA